MKKNQVLLGVCLVGTLLLAVGAVFLPRYLGRALDMQEYGQVHTQDRYGFSFVKMSEGNLSETAAALDEILANPNELTPLVTFHSLEELEKQEYGQELLRQIWVNLQPPLVAVGVTLDTSFLENLREMTYYSLESKEGSISGTQSESRKSLNFWLLQLTDEAAYDYRFLVDALNFQVYYLELSYLEDLMHPMVLRDVILSVYGMDMHMDDASSYALEQAYDNMSVQSVDMFLHDYGQAYDNIPAQSTDLFLYDYDQAVEMQAQYMVSRTLDCPGVAAGFTQLMERIEG